MPEQLTHEEIRHALKYVSDYSRDNWIRTGMALKLAGYPFEIWREWSEADPGHVWKDREGLQQWRSFKKDSGQVVTLGTVIGQAKRNGWKRSTTPSAEPLPKLQPMPEAYQEAEQPKEPETDISAQIEKAYQNLKADPDAVNHITARGLTEKTIDLFRIGYLPAGMKEAFPDLPEYHGNRFAYVYKYSFPFITLNGCRYAVFENESRAPQILEKTPKYIFPAGIRKPLYNEIIFQTDFKPETVFITEGIYDCLSIEQCGRRAAALCGTAPAPLIDALKRNNVSKETRFIIALDSDQAGEKGSERLTEILTEAGYISVRYAFQGTKADGTPIKDANELLIADPAELIRQLNEAEEIARNADQEQYKPKLPEEIPYNYLLSPPPLKRPVISGFLREHEAMLISGQSKAGKSFLTAQLAHAIATGGTWIGQKCNKKSVLYIDGELSSEMTAQRFKAMREKMRIPVPPEDLHVINARGSGVTLEAIAEDISHDCHKYDVIIIDPLYMFIESDENDNSQMKNEMHIIAKICACGCSVIVIHHMAKGIQTGKFSIDRASGAGVIGRFFDSILTVNKLETEPGDTGTPERIEADTRSFSQPAPVHLWFNDGFHNVDTSGDLSFRSLANPQKVSTENKKNDDIGKLNHCYEYMRENGILNNEGMFTVKDLQTVYEKRYGKALARNTAYDHLKKAGYIKVTGKRTTVKDGKTYQNKVNYYMPDDLEIPITEADQESLTTDDDGTIPKGI